jgi:hypothetical protein
MMAFDTSSRTATFDMSLVSMVFVVKTSEIAELFENRCEIRRFFEI